MSRAETESAHTDAGRRGFLARLARIVGAALSGLLLLVILLVGGLYLRLAAGPIDAASLAPRIEAEASARLPGARLTVGGAEIALDEAGGGATVVVTDATLIDDETGPFARIPRGAATFRIADLVQGRFSPSDVTLTGISGRLVRQESGAYRFGFGGLTDDDAGDGAAAFGRLMEVATAGGDGPAAQDEPSDRADRGRQQLKLRDASILYIDKLSGRVFRTKTADLTFGRAPEATTASADIVLGGGRNGPVRIALDGRRTETGAVTLSTVFSNAAPRDLASQFRDLDWLAALDAPVSGDIEFGLDETGALTALAGRMESGDGRVTLAPGRVEAINSAVIDFSFDPGADRFLIDDASVDLSRAALSASGFVDVKRGEDGAPEDVVAQLDLEDMRVAAPEYLEAPLSYREGRVTGRVSLAPLEIEIGELHLAGEGLRLSAAGRLSPGADGWRADITAGGGDFSLADMLAHWPRQAAPGAREWIAANMEAAHIIDVDAAIRVGGEAEGAPDEVKIDFTFDEATGHYLRPMPPIRNGAGAGQVDLTRFTLSLDRGWVTPTGGDALDLAGSTFVIEDLNAPGTPGTATVLASGATADALALIDEEPLALTSELGAPLGDVGGAAEIKAVANFPLLDDLPLEDVMVEAEAALTDVSLIAPGLGRKVTAESLALTADTSAFTLGGDAVVDGIPASIAWTESFDPADRKISVTTRLTPERLRGFDVEQEVFTAGSIAFSATIDPDGASTAFNASADLTNAALDLEAIGWRKAAGARADLTARGSYGDDGALALDAFDLASPDLEAAGAAAFSASGAPRRVSLSSLKYRGAVDLAVDAVRAGDGWKVTATGPLLDLTGLDDILDDAAAGEGGAGSSGDPLAFSADLGIERLRLAESLFFTDVDVSVRRTPGSRLTVQGDASVSGGARATVDFARGPEGGEATARIDDAGRFLRDAGIFDDGAGGVLTAEARIAPGGALALEGQIRVADIVIHEDAKLEQLMMRAERADLRETMRRDGVVFAKIKAPFTYADDRVTLKDAIATGPFIGVNISGDYDLEADRLDMSGVFSPFYQLSAALGKIPVVGDILTGGDGQGVFAFNFTVKGPAEDPQISVNPLSVLTPGIIRRVFDIKAASPDVDAGVAEGAINPKGLDIGR